MPNSAQPLSHIRLHQIPRLAQAGRWRIEAMHSYPHHLLLWVTRGQGRITVSGNTRGYGAHNAIFIPARTMHCFDMTAQVFGTAAFIPATLVLDMPAAAHHIRVRDAGSQAKVTGILDNLSSESESPRLAGARAMQHHAGLLSVWLERMIAETAADRKRPNASVRLIERYCRLIEDNLHSGNSVTDYCATLGVTPTHLSRACNVTCGRPALALLTERIMFEARDMLAATTIPVKDIARSLGFTSAAYFTRSFQHHTGKTPSAFRQKT
ncbi:helix-turn-helix domain-containing protein [Pseudogemmobacter sp. W21_MBD1_M6]|uniref:helix-turn-helix domain-containing protein n=1 Tax=Pseudogemmobacter sp. W21_MBD1_M6 TaxID=3240271 RepID=UPI003F999B69